MTTRLFLLGVVILFFGIQLRSFDTFVLNERVSGFINDRVAKKQEAAPVDPLKADFMMLDDQSATPAVNLPKHRKLTPPRWLGYSFLSIGAVLVLSCPLCRP